MQLNMMDEAHWAKRGLLSSSNEYRDDIARIVDVFLLWISFSIAHWIRVDEWQLTPPALVVTLLFMLFFNMTASSIGFYTRIQSKGYLRIGLTGLYAYFLTICLVSLIATLTHTAESFSRIWFVVGSLLGVGSIILVRGVFLYSLASGWLRLNAKRSVIIGEGSLGQELARRVLSDSFHSSELVGFFTEGENADQLKSEFADIPVLGSSSQVEAVLEKYRAQGNPIDRVFVALPSSQIDTKISLIKKLISTQYHTFVVPDYSLNLISNSRSDDIAGLPVIDVSHTRLQGARATSKTVIDFTLSAVGIIILSPVFILVATAIKLQTPGPVLFVQRRYGLGGKEIRVYKFRTMKVVEDGNNVVQATKNDPRITRIGKFLRSTSLDEIPQLFNVLNGSMSIVGPRPHAVSHNEQYRRLIVGYMRRHAMKPGITGWAQINGCRGETPNLETMQKRIDYDWEYLQKWSLSLDLIIMFKTVALVLRGDNAY